MSESVLDLSLVSDIRGQEEKEPDPTEPAGPNEQADPKAKNEPWTYMVYFDRETCGLHVEFNPQEMKTYEFGIAVTDMVKQWFDQMKRNVQMQQMQAMAAQAQRDMQIAQNLQGPPFPRPGRRR